MKRRELLGAASAGALLAGCGKDRHTTAAVATGKPQTRHGKMVTTWPRNFPGLGTGANRIAQLITEMSGGRIDVKV